MKLLQLVYLLINRVNIEFFILHYQYIISYKLDQLINNTISIIFIDQPGTAPSATRWTVLLIDMSYVLSAYLNYKYAYLKSVRLCANMYVKGLFTSDTEYEPGIVHYLSIL